MNSSNNIDSTLLFKRQTSLPQPLAFERGVDPRYQGIKLTESHEFYTPESNKYESDKDNSLFRSLNSFEKESYFSADKFGKSSVNYLGKYKDISLKSTIDGGSSIAHEDNLSLSQSSFQNECEFSFGFKQQTVTTSSSKLESKLFLRTSTKSSPNVKRQAIKLQKHQIMQFEKVNDNLLKSQKEISLINQISKFLAYNLRNLSGLTYLETNKCFQTIGFKQIINKRNHWQKLVAYQLDSFGKSNIPVTIFMFSIFKTLNWNFESFEIYFWMLAQLRAYEAEMYYEQSIPLPLIINGKQNIEIVNTLVFIPTNYSNSLEANQLEQIYHILSPKTNNSYKKQKSSFKYTNKEKTNSPLSIPSIENICQRQQDVYQVNVNINSIGISIQFDLFQQDNLEDIVDQLSQDYSLPPFVKNQFLQQLRKSFNQI